MKLKTPKFPSKGHHQPAPPVGVQPPPPAPAQPGMAAHAALPQTPSPQAQQRGAGHVGVAAPPASPLKKVAGGLTAPTRQRNAAVMIAGLALIVVAGAMGASVASSFDDSIDVLVAAGPIAEGQPLEADDFRVVQIAAGAGDIQAVSPDSIDDLVGRVAAGPIGEGSMIHPAQFADGAEEVRVVVGAALGPDQYPANGLKPNDQVRLIEVASKFAGFEESDGFVAGREIAVGEITDVVTLSQQDTLHFSIRIGESVASVVAERIAQDRLVLALVDGSVALDQIKPLIPAEPVIPLDFDETEEPAE